MEFRNSIIFHDFRLFLLFKKGAENPDSKIIYTELNEKFERFCKYIYVAFLDTLGGGTICFISLSYINYYILDLGDESFLLSTPVMYAMCSHINTIVCAYRNNFPFFG